MNTDRPAPRAKPGRVPGLPLRVVLAALGLFWEVLWRVLWLPASALALFAALSLFDIWRHVSPGLHSLILITILVSFAASLYRQRRLFRAWDRTVALRRIEQEAGLAHHPLLGLEDRLALGAASAEAQTLWQAHQQRMRDALPRLRFVIPRPQAIRLDRFGLRQVAGILFVAGLLAAGPQSWERIQAGFQPLGFKSGATGALLEAWITPPAYTGMAPVLLAGRAAPAPSGDAPDAAITAPIGSILSLRLFESAAGEVRLIPQSGKETRISLTKIDSANSQALIKLERDQQVQLRQSGGADQEWQIKIIPDQPPHVAMLDALKISKQFAININYGATDDYGVTRVEAEFSLTGDPAQPPHSAQLPLPPRDGENAAQTAYVDMTAHPWAGLPVRLVLKATDAAEQTGTSPVTDFILPQRPFSHPMARALIEQRKLMAAKSDRDENIIRALDALSLYPDQFMQELPVYLGLRVARHRLEQAAGVAENRAQVMDLLWTLALGLEDGNLSIAADELRRLQQQLMQALRNGASDDEIARLTQALREALREYLQAMREQAEDDLSNGEPPPDAAPGNQKSLKQSDLEALLEQIEKLGKTGARQAAQEMLSKLQNILENLQAGSGSPEKSPRQQLYENALGNLSKMLRQQQNLRDQAFQRDQQGQGGKAGGQGKALGKDQQALRQSLGDLMRELGEGVGEIPNPLGRAERAMRDAEDALQQGQTGEALAPQGEALDQLRAGAEAMAKALREETAKAEAENGQGNRGGAPGGENDPLGRSLANDPGGPAAIPEQFDVERALQIRRELEQRASQRRRPVEELDYIDRLLKLF